MATRRLHRNSGLLNLYDFSPGTAPLLVSMPHCGTYIPPRLAADMTPEALSVPDTDFHLPRLYDFVRELGASVLAATHSRYVIDLNRPPDGAVLYPGASNTELCPTTRFDFAPVYREGRAPDMDGIRARVADYWEPYHARLAGELERIHALHDYALLFDAHSIVSVCPRFFEGRLTDINLGTADGASCAPALGAAVLEAAQEYPGYTSILNGRFKGGFITRRYGKPDHGVHAVQLELAERTYMDEAPPFAYDETLAESVRPVLRSVLEAMLSWKPR
ncbi:MAG: N-formylglutamate deformylase [Burkholderiales bacterium]|nr:N-formylglutamate deformylase [Burkholderiales bacterium]